jgi:molybdopterin-guanine dinucleotide biosynthesis protein A
MMDVKTLNRSAIIICGGLSKRFGKNKRLFELLGKPLISYVIHEVNHIVDEVIVVVASEEQKKVLTNQLSSSVRIIIDEYALRAPIVGALTGFKYALGKYSLLLPCDTPLISRKVILLLFKLAYGLEAVIPKWPNNYIEPLQAVYQTKPAYKASLEAVNSKKMRMKNMIMHMNNLLYISTTIIQKIDPTFNTFLNINTPEDLRKIAKTLVDASSTDRS